jgi:cytosine/adenosine deaminase-related metal-dependent hydrolase
VSAILIEGCEAVVTMDDAGTEIPGGSILVEGGTIAWVGAGTPPHREDALRVDGRGAVALPGLINTHHHLYQTLTRVRAQDDGLFGWLRELYPVWAGLNEEWEWAAARVALAELVLSGCSTTTDHHYVFPHNGGPRAEDQSLAVLGAEVEAAREIGVRFHPTRGSMDRGESQGGLPPDAVVQDADTILAETETAVRRFHDPAPGSMLRLGIAPCSPFSATDRLMRESAGLARRLGVRLHTHIAETLDEDAYCVQTYGLHPVELLDALGWLGPDVWLAHCVHLNEDHDDAGRIARAGTAVAWCPTSNLRLGSGVAPVHTLRRKGAVVGLAVDGGASNDSGNLLAEARLGLLVSRRESAGAMGARDILRIATRGGAACLGRDDVGSLEPGRRADIALFSVEGLPFTGAEADPIAAVVFCSSQRVRDLWVEGQPVVRDGRLVTADEDEIAAAGRRIGRRILREVAR